MGKNTKETFFVLLQRVKIFFYLGTKLKTR